MKHVRMIGISGLSLIFLVLVCRCSFESGVNGFELCSGIGGCKCLYPVVICRNVNPFSLTAFPNPRIEKMDWKFCQISDYKNDYFEKFSALKEVDISYSYTSINCESLPLNPSYKLISDCPKGDRSSSYFFTTLFSSRLISFSPEEGFSSPSDISTTDEASTRYQESSTSEVATRYQESSTSKIESSLSTLSQTPTSKIESSFSTLSAPQWTTPDFSNSYTPSSPDHSSTSAFSPEFEVDSSTDSSVSIFTTDQTSPAEGNTFSTTILISSVGVLIFVILLLISIVIYFYRKNKSKKYRYRSYKTNDIYKPVSFHIRKRHFQVVDPREEQKEHEETIGGDIDENEDEDNDDNDETEV